MSTQNPDDLTAAAAAELRRDMAGLSPDEQAAAKTMLGSIGDKWWLLLALGIISLIVGVLIVLNPAQAFNVILIFFGIWLIISGILNIVRGFGDKLESGARVLSIIVGALSLILGGAIGNVIDRLVHGQVVDFLLAHWFDRWYFPAFNVADSAITVGAVLLILDELLRVRNSR